MCQVENVRGPSGRNEILKLKSLNDSNQKRKHFLEVGKYRDTMRISAGKTGDMNPQWLNIIYKLQLLVGNFNIPEKTLPPLSLYLSLGCKETSENHGMTPQEFLGILTISGVEVEGRRLGAMKTSQWRWVKMVYNHII